jgi:hypothetical protein
MIVKTFLNIFSRLFVFFNLGSFRSIRDKNYVNKLLEFNNDLSLPFKQLKSCDEWHKAEFPRKGKGTIRFRYEPLHDSFESFSLLLGDIEFD